MSDDTGIMKDDEIRKLNDTGWIAEHRALYLRDGEAGHMWDSSVVGGPGPLPTLLLFTKGCKSGQDSIMPVLYGKFDVGYVIIGSKGGHASHPGWYHNLQAQPKVQIKVKNDTFAVRHRVAKGAERQTILAQMAQIYPAFTDYDRRARGAGREIPVIVLEQV